MGKPHHTAAHTSSANKKGVKHESKKDVKRMAKRIKYQNKAKKALRLGKLVVGG